MAPISKIAGRVRVGMMKEIVGGIRVIAIEMTAGELRTPGMRSR